jgi:hypothetical protein
MLRGAKGILAGALAVVACGSVSDPNHGRPDGPVAVDPAVEHRDAALPVDVPPAVLTSVPALPFWTASGGGSSSTATTQLGVSIGGATAPQPLVAPGGSRLSIGIFPELTR